MQQGREKYNGLHKRDTYEEIIDYLQNKQQIIKYPDRWAKRTRESPYLTNLDYDGVMEMKDFEERQMKERETQERLNEIARENPTRSAQELRILDTQGGSSSSSSSRRPQGSGGDAGAGRSGDGGWGGQYGGHRSYGMPQDEGAGHVVDEANALSTSGWFSAYQDAALYAVANRIRSLAEIGERNAIRLGVQQTNPDYEFHFIDPSAEENRLPRASVLEAARLQSLNMGIFLAAGAAGGVARVLSSAPAIRATQLIDNAPSVIASGVKSAAGAAIRTLSPIATAPLALGYKAVTSVPTVVEGGRTLARKMTPKARNLAHRAYVMSRELTPYAGQGFNEAKSRARALKPYLLKGEQLLGDAAVGTYHTLKEYAPPAGRAVKSGIFAGAQYLGERKEAVGPIVDRYARAMIAKSAAIKSASDRYVADKAVGALGVMAAIMESSGKRGGSSVPIADVEGRMSMDQKAAFNRALANRPAKKTRNATPPPPTAKAAKGPAMTAIGTKGSEKEPVMTTMRLPAYKGKKSTASSSTALPAQKSKTPFAPAMLEQKTKFLAHGVA